MSTLLSSLGRWSYRHPWRVMLSWLLALGIAGTAAVVLGAGTDNSFAIPGTESQDGIEQLERSFPQASGASAQFIVVAARGEHVTDADYRDRIEDSIDELTDLSGVLAVTSPYDKRVSGLVNSTKTAAIVRLQFDGEASTVTAETRDALTREVTELSRTLPEDSRTSLGGELFASSVPGVTPTEAIGLLVALLVLIVTFRSFVVAGLPLLTAVWGVAIAMAGIFAATAFATISATTPLLALMLGLAVGIDYALFIMARHQDQVREGVEPEESAARAVGTAGSAVVFAGVTVLIALIGLGLAGIPFLTTMGVAASVAVGVGVLIAVTLTPAMLGILKGRIAGRQKRSPRADAAQQTAAPARKISRRWVSGVIARPVLTSIAVILGLAVAALPALSLSLALPNAGVLPKDNQARHTYDLISEEFGPGFNGPLILTGTIVTSTDPLGLMEDLGEAAAKVDGVQEVALAVPNQSADTGIVQVIPETAPDDPATAQLVRDLRAQHDEWLDEYGIDVKVTGFTAVGIDVSDQIGKALLPFGIFVIGLSLILLTIVFRSLWVPLTAALGYLLSVGAAFGVVSAVFEWGWLADALHVAKVGPLISFMPIIVMGVLFGLAMDYQVFIVSRMREDYVHDPDSTSDSRTARRAAALRAVHSGFSGSAKVVTAAALIMFAVFVAFVPEGDSSLKPIALGLASGIAIDAFLVRMTLIPALMAILGERAWQLPATLARRLPTVDIEGAAVERERDLASWPGDASVVAVDGLAVRAAGVRDLNLRVAPGESAVITGASAATLRTVALVIAGRVQADSGQLRVAGHLLPGRGAWVRAHVGAVIAVDGVAPAADLTEALRGRPPLVVIDGVENLPSAARDQLAARLREAPEGMSALFTSTSPESAKAVLESAGRPRPAVIDLRDSGDRSESDPELSNHSRSSEVHA